MKKEKGLRAFLFCAMAVGVVLIVAGFLYSGKQDSSSDGRIKTEREITDFLEKSGSIENVSVKLCFLENGKVTGAAVVCRNGEDAKVQKEVVGLLTVLLDLGAHQVYVSGA